jgi:phosphopantetheine adenylyltransferase
MSFKLFKKILLQILFIQLLLVGFAHAQLSSDFDTSLLSSEGKEIKVGIAPGSFDPTTTAHRDLIIESIKRLNLDKFVVAVNVMTSKDFNLSVAERIEMTKRSFGSYANKVIVVARPFDNLDKLAEVIRGSFNGPLHVVLGEDVFDKNYKLLNHIEGTQFSMIPRPEGLAERVNLDLYARSKLLDISFPGISSSASRELIVKGLDASGSLPAEVIEFLKERDLMRVYTKDMHYLRRDIMQNKIKKLTAYIQRKFNYSASEKNLTYKVLQSPEAQVEKIIREVVDQNKLSPQQASELRNSVLNYSAQHQNSQRVGYFRGSFDPINKEQIDIVEKMMRDLKLDKIVVAVISNNPNSVVEGASIRTQLAKIAFKNHTNVHVMTEPESGATEVLKLMQKEMGPKPIAIFGDTVFEKNYVQLKMLENIEFAVIKKVGDETKNSGAQYEVMASESKINSKDHESIFHKSETTLDHKVNEEIIQKGYYQRFRVISCNLLFAS